MNPNVRRVGLALLCLLITSSAPAQTGPTMTYQLRTKDFDNSPSAQLLVTADVPATFGRVDIQFVSPPGFVADPASLRFDPQPGKRIVAVNLRRIGDVSTDEYSVLAHATALPSGSTAPPFSVDQAVNFTYTRRLQVKFYFLLGLVGSVLGYLLRIVTGVLKRIPVPAPALPEGDEEVEAPHRGADRAGRYRGSPGPSTASAHAGPASPCAGSSSRTA